MKASMMRRLRVYHHYLGVLFAPAILFFAFSGALQTFDFHERRAGVSPPPRWISVIASLHKKQAMPRPKLATPQRATPPDEGLAKKAGAPPARAYPLALKAFVGLMSIGLMLSTLIGLVVALNNARMRTLSLVLLAAGSALPLLLVLA